MRVAEKERPTQKPSRNEVNRKRDKKRSRLSAFDTPALSQPDPGLPVLPAVSLPVTKGI